MMRMVDTPHPIHLHGKPLRVIERSGVRHDGYKDEGWIDIVLLIPGERIRILVGFDDYRDYSLTIATTWNMRIWE